MKNFLNTSGLKKMFSYGDRIQPVRDWLVLITVASALLALSIGWNIYLFYEIENGKALGATSAVPHKSAEESVTQVQDIFKSRATEEGNYQNQYHFVDPSVPSS